MRFGSSTSDLRWVWLYTCNFLTTGTYVTEASLKEMMTGVHIVMGYASQSLLCDPMAQHFGTYLRRGEPVIDAYFHAGKTGEGPVATDNHLQRVLYVPQARYKTIFSSPVHYAYTSTDVQIIERHIKNVEM